MNVINSELHAPTVVVPPEHRADVPAVHVADPRADAMNAELRERLDALESEEYRSSDSYRLGDRVLAASLFWMGLGIAVWILTLLLWH